MDIVTAPTREQAATFGGSNTGWNPYFAMFDTFDPLNDARDQYVYEACPPFPKGDPWDAYGIWSRDG